MVNFLVNHPIVCQDLTKKISKFARKATNIGKINSLIGQTLKEIVKDHQHGQAGGQWFKDPLIKGKFLNKTYKNVICNKIMKEELVTLKFFSSNMSVILS